MQVLPAQNYDFRHAKRAPIMKYGYHAFAKGDNVFTGKFEGEGFGGLNDLYRMWTPIRKDINTPYILLHAQNENWGIFSTLFPNRTVDWGRCCDDAADRKHLKEFLDDDNLLMFLINQHSNISHPKVLTIPRGLPGPDEFSRKMVWDVMRNTLKRGTKGRLLFTAASSWGPRPQIIKCVRSKFHPDDFQGLYAGPELKKSPPRISKVEYYTRLAAARFCLAVPGLGYDTYR